MEVGSGELDIAKSGRLEGPVHGHSLVWLQCLRGPEALQRARFNRRRVGAANAIYEPAILRKLEESGHGEWQVERANGRSHANVIAGAGYPGATPDSGVVESVVVH